MGDPPQSSNQPAMKKKLPRFYFSYRYLMAFMGFVGVAHHSALLSSLPFGWVCMAPLLGWSKDIQQHVFAAYSLGGAISLIFGGRIIDRFQAKRVMGVSLGLASAATFLIPIMAPMGYIYVAGLRMLVGAMGSLSLPLIYNICSQWSTRSETGFMFCFIFSGHHVAQFTMRVIGGSLCSYVGWPWVFYGLSISTSAFVLLWLLCYRNDPDECASMR